MGAWQHSDSVSTSDMPGKITDVAELLGRGIVIQTGRTTLVQAVEEVAPAVFMIHIL